MKLGELKHVIGTMQEVTVKRHNSESLPAKWYQVLDYKNAEDWGVENDNSTSFTN